MAVDGEVVGAIGSGLCVFVGVTHTDGDAGLRVMDDDEGVMNLSVVDTDGEVLVVSQFTLYGDASRGRRPTWLAAARPEHAEPLVERVVSGLRDRGIGVATGHFRAHMAVDLVNDGPVTIILEA